MSIKYEMTESDIKRKVITVDAVTIQGEVSLQCSDAKEWKTYFDKKPPVVKQQCTTLFLS